MSGVIPTGFALLERAGPPASVFDIVDWKEKRRRRWSGGWPFGHRNDYWLWLRSLEDTMNTAWPLGWVGICGNSSRIRRLKPACPV